ncbi:CPBP family intramembrane metalloprotease, partial [Pediococcus acidilactici]|nr:CPBP family intramembrane metalloprotease [Pediococcus acidilactici]
MIISNSSLLTLITSLAIFLLPSVINLFVRLGASFIWVETIDYLVGAALLVVINLKNNEINQIETRRIPFFRAIAWGIIGTALVIVLQFVVSYVT